MAGDTVGGRIASYRRQCGLSQAELGAVVHRSESWVSQVERNVQPVERLSILQVLAAALGVSVRDLRPEVVPEDEGEPPPRVNDLDGVRLTLSGHPAAEGLFAQSQPLADLDAAAEELRRGVERAWDLAHADRFADLSASLTDLLPRLEQTVRQVDEAARPPIHSLRARAYQVASAAFARQDETDAAWVAADRAIAAAELAGNPLEVIAGHFRLAHAFIRLNRLEQAERVIRSGLDALGPIAGDADASPEVVALFGAMHLAQAVASARDGNRSAAHAHLDEATALGARIGTDRNDFDTEFGPTNVELHRVAVAVDLGDAGEALEIAQAVDASNLSPERQARFLVDVARAHAQRRHVGEATAALAEADRLAPEHVRAHNQARATLEDLLTQAGRRPPANLVELAERAGAIP